MGIVSRLSYEELEKRLEIQETLVECTQTLLSKENDFGVSVSNVLSIIAGFYSAETVSIYEFNKDRSSAKSTYRWSIKEDEDNEFGIYELDNLTIAECFDSLEEKSEIYIDIDENTDGNSIISDYFKDYHIENLMAVPLFQDGQVYGFICVENLKRNKDSVLLLQSVAAYILNDIKKNDSFEQKILHGISDMYLSMHLINLCDNTFHGFKCIQHIEALLTSNDSFNYENASEQIRFVMTSLTDPDFLSGVLRFVNLSTVEQRLGSNKIISHEFYGKVSGWCRASFIPVSKDVDGKLKYVIFSVQQIEEEKRRELEYQEILRNTLGEQNEIYTEMLQAQSAGIFSFKKESHEILMMNPAALNLFGWDSIVSANGNIHTIFGKMESPKKDAIINKILNMRRGDPEFIFEFSIKKSETEIRWILGHSKTVRLSNNEEIVINSFTDITANKRMETELFYLSQTDALTKINNRGSGERRIELLLKKGECGMFCLFDADKFKSINDNFGHAVGDEVLIEIAKAMKRAFRGNDIIMRLGGDEFAIFAVGITDKKIGAMCIERFFACINEISIKALRDRKIAVSLGAVLAGGTGETFDHLYTQADELLYECKKLPGSQYSFYQKD